MNRALIRLGIAIWIAAIVLAIATGTDALYWGAGVGLALMALGEWAF
jgi:hypothetical protein